ncbi:MAG: hypothetical protein IJ756_06380 [Paludibacteraceae bacterium]|nr:hypothetical protein [Paludibacteraceae bacterium]
MFLAINLYADYAENIPITLYQPNGDILNCYVSGDEYYSWFHNKEGYTIINDTATGYYCYAQIKNGKLFSSKIIANQLPIPDTISARALPNDSVIETQYAKYNNYIKYPYVYNRSSAPNSTKTIRTLNNIVVFIRFSDQNEFLDSLNYFYEIFNSADENVVISNTNNVPSNVNASNSISTAGSVTITSNKNVKLEAGNCVVLNSEFMIENGGQLEININPCGNK